MGDHRIVIRNACIHITNEQPLLADLFAMPDPRDLTLVCTNLRSMNGSRPVFVDAKDSVFVFPYTHIRFIEIPAGAVNSPVDAAGEPATDRVGVAAGRGGSAHRAVDGPDGSANGALTMPAEPDASDLELELDEDFLRRVREV